MTEILELMDICMATETEVLNGTKHRLKANWPSKRYKTAIKHLPTNNHWWVLLL